MGVWVAGREVVPTEPHGRLQQTGGPVVAEHTGAPALQRPEVVTPGQGVLTDGMEQTLHGQLRRLLRQEARPLVLVAGGRVVADGPTEQIRSRATGRTVSADVTDTAVAQRVRDHPGVGEVDLAGHRLTVTVSPDHSDDVARFLLGSLNGSNLEITSGSLESAFVALTSSTANPTAGSSASPTSDTEESRR